MNARLRLDVAKHLREFKVICLILRKFVDHDFRVKNVWGIVLLYLIFGVFLVGQVCAPPTVNSKTLYYGVRADAPPFSSCDSDQATNCQGFTVELCEEIADLAVKLGLFDDYEPKIVTALDRFELLYNQDIQMLCGASTVTMERMRVADFSSFTFVSGLSVMYKENPIFKGVAEENVIKIGVLKNTTTETETEEKTLWHEIKADLRYPDEVEGQYDDTFYESHREGIERLLKGKIHLYLADREILLAYQKKHLKSRLVVSKKYYSIEPYAIGLQAGNLDLRYAANKVLLEKFGDPSSNVSAMPIFELLSKYFPNSRFSTDLLDMYRLQRIKRGGAVKDSNNKNLLKPLQ